MIANIFLNENNPKLMSKTFIQDLLKLDALNYLYSKELIDEKHYTVIKEKIKNRTLENKRKV